MIANYKEFKFQVGGREITVETEIGRASCRERV